MRRDVSLAPDDITPPVTFGIFDAWHEICSQKNVMTSSPMPKMFLSPSRTARRAHLLHRLQNKGLALRKLHDRERRRLRQDVSRVPGLMTLLMRPRNGRSWTSAERDALRTQLCSMRRLGLYVAVLLIPGTALTLPLLAWWLDRRHARRYSSATDVREVDAE